MPRAQLTTNGLKQDLRKRGYTSAQKSIAEYIWNGFDAGASIIKLTEVRNAYGVVTSISISDNGSGIKDINKFEPVLESTKKEYEANRTSSIPHGKNGLGRFTFFVFADEIKWKTVYKDNNNLNSTYEVKIFSYSLLDWNPTPSFQTEEDVGTTVTISSINASFTNLEDPIVIDYIKREFSWLLEMNKSKSFKIIINDSSIDTSNLILESSEKSKKFVIDEYDLEFNFIQWTHKLNEEFSRYYFIDEKNEERYSKTTTLNNKGDGFFHSIFIKSSLFSRMESLELYEGNITNKTLFQETSEGKTYRKVLDYLDSYLFNKRRPFLEIASNKLIYEFEKNFIFSQKYDENNELDQFKKEYLYRTIKDLYQVQPRIFTSLKTEQKKIFVRFIEALQNSGKSDKILEIVQEVLSLNSEELSQLTKTLKSSRLSNIVKTIQLIEDRYRLINYLDSIVFKKELNANERDHVQKLIETNYWIFGEKYHLVSSEEPNFEAALRGYLHLLRGMSEKEKNEIIHIDDPGRRKQMDIFMCRKSMSEDIIHHIVVELKHPDILLGQDEPGQVERYMSTILKEPRFNSNKSIWEFHLIGNRFDTSGIIETRIDSMKNHGEKSLVISVKNYKVYVKTWSEVIDDVEIRHNFLNEVLNLEKSKLIEDENLKSASKIVLSASELSSSLPGPIAKTKKQVKRVKK